MNLNVRNAGIFMNPSVFVQTAKTRGPAPAAGGMKAKSNCPSFHPPDPDQARIWVVLRLPVLARPAAVFREPDDQCSRVLHLLTIFKEYRIMETSNTQKKGKDMSIWIILGVIAVWVLLQAYILPKMGIST